MPRASRAQSEATAARILEEARRLYTQQGYAATSVDQVARASAVTRGAVYHHYGSGEQLFAKVHERVQADVADAVAAATAGATDARESLLLGSRAFLDAALGDGIREVMLVDAPSVLGWRRWRETDEAQSAEHLRVGLGALAREGRLRGEPGAVAALLSGAMNEAALWVASADDPAAAHDEVWAALERLLLAVTGPASPT